MLNPKKNYKAGQIVTVKNKVYRICKNKDGIACCSICSLYSFCHFYDIDCVRSIGWDNHFKLVKV